MAPPLSIIARKPAQITIRRDTEDQKYLIKIIFHLRLLISLVLYIIIIYNKTFMNNI